MTTLIIHPDITVQRSAAFDLAAEYLEKESSLIAEIAQAKAAHPDLHILDGTSANSIGIDDVREIIRKLNYQPYEAPVQVGLILLSNLLTEEAQNSLLKSLEEPGEQTRFILTTPHEKLLLPTILSRSKKIFVAENVMGSNLAAQDGPGPSTTDDSTTQPDIPAASEFLQQDIVDQLVEVEDIVNEDKESPGALIDFLNNLVNTYRAELIKTTSNKDQKAAAHYANDIRRINRAIHFIKKNANKRITLENLVLQLEKSRIAQGELSGI